MSDIKISILIPVYNVELQWLEAAIDSVKKQTYGNWELCLYDDCSTREEVREYLSAIHHEKIKVRLAEKNQGIALATNAAAEMADGDYLLLMDNDDELSHDAVEEVVKKIHQTKADIVYSDQDIVDSEGNHRDPFCKPDWSPDLLLSQMYIGHVLVFKKSLFDQVGGFRKEYTGSQDYDLMLRMSRKTDKIEHIAKVLYSWRAIPTSTANNPESKPYAQTAGLNAVQDHLDAVYGTGRAVAKETKNMFVYDVRYELKQEPKVSVIIPTKDHVDLLKNAVDTLISRTDYSNYEILILDNNSEEEETREYFEQVVSDTRIRVEKAEFPFNWSRLNNYGMSLADGEVYIFLNNDVEIASRDWMRRLAEKVVLPDVGVAGGLLLYEDNTIQHAGVVASMGGWADHVFKGMKPVHFGSPFVSPMVTRNVTAVTGACMAISKATIDKIGGFDENFIICGSDVEICVRANDQGLRVIYDPYVRLYHFESKTRDSFVPEIDFELSEKMYRPFRENGDPYYNNQLDYYSCVPALKGTEKPAVQNADGICLDKMVQTGGPAEPDQVDTHIAEINPYTLRKSEYNKKRINILLPSLNPEHVFGGIATAFKFFEQLADKLGFDRRIILVDAEPNDAVKELYGDRYSFVSWDEDSDAASQILPYSAREGRSFPVGKQDYFMLTGWWTSHCIQEAYEEYERTEGIRPNVFLNFIQDYEPGFYAWSTHYLLADATYKNEYPQIAVFNTRLLQDYFHRNGYSFYKEFAFDPVLNKGLKDNLDKQGEFFRKKKQILIYGRPGTDRNAFKLIVAALKKWVNLQNDIEDWEILSAGEQHGKVCLGRGKYLVSVGKLTIDEYANVLAESYAGISLMASPHPSYPPLEMSVFGVKVITNTFANKDMSSFNHNMVSVSNISPNNIAYTLQKICDDYRMIVKNQNENPQYIDNENVFGFIDEIKEILCED